MTVSYTHLSDLLAERSLLTFNEADKIAANIGKTQSQGFELTINTTNFNSKDFSWNTDFTFSFYRDTVSYTHLATGIRNVEAIPPADTCPSEAVPWHIPPDMCSPNLSSGNRNSGLSRWIDKFGSFQSSRSIFSKRALGRGIPGALPNSTDVYKRQDQSYSGDLSKRIFDY